MMEKIAVPASIAIENTRYSLTEAGLSAFARISL
jgi:hypothetical protein